jgi:hypothetical protein
MTRGFLFLRSVSAATGSGVVRSGPALTGWPDLLAVRSPATLSSRLLIAPGARVRPSRRRFTTRDRPVIARIRNRYPDIVDGMTEALTRDMSRGNATSELDEFYAHLPTLDFSCSVVQGAESALCVFTAPACGWTDLGTPRRVKNALHRLWSAPQRGAYVATRHVPAFVNLAARYAQFGDASADTARG